MIYQNGEYYVINMLDLYYRKEIGQQARLQDEELIFIKMDQNILGNGLMISNMEMERRYQQMEQLIWASLGEERNKGKG